MVLQTLLLTLWAYALMKLLAKLKGTQKLIPKKGMFILHAVLIGVYLLCYLGASILNDFVDSNFANEAFWIVLTFSDFFQVLGFLLVLYLMIAVTDGHKGRKLQFQTFLMNGFADLTALQAAILKTNPNMTEAELKCLDEDLERFNDMLRESTCSSIVSEMVNYESLPYDNFNKVVILS